MHRSTKELHSIKLEIQHRKDVSEHSIKREAPGFKKAYERFRAPAFCGMLRKEGNDGEID